MGLAYSHLSRIKNESASPRADALDGVLRELLKLEDCLPDAIVQRLSHEEQMQPTGSLKRATCCAGQSSPDAVRALASDLAACWRLSPWRLGAAPRRSSVC